MQPDYENSGETYGEVSPDTLRLLIEVEDAFQRFEMEVLRGRKLVIDYKNRKKSWEPISKNSKARMNSLGISEVLSRMRGRVSSITRLTYKEDEQIAIDMFQFHASLIELFEKRGDEWELDEELTKPLVDACVEFVQDIVQSSRRGFNAVNLRSQYQKTESSNTTEQPVKKSFLGLSLGGNK